MEIKKVKSVVVTGAELAKIISYYVRDHYKKDMEFKRMKISGDAYDLITYHKNIQIEFETE